MKALSILALLGALAGFGSVASAAPVAAASPAPAEVTSAPRSAIGNTMRAIGTEAQGFGPKADSVAAGATGAVASTIDRAAHAAEVCNRLSVEHPEMKEKLLEEMKCRVNPRGYAKKRGFKP